VWCHLPLEEGNAVPCLVAGGLLSAVSPYFQREQRKKVLALMSPSKKEGLGEEKGRQ